MPSFYVNPGSNADLHLEVFGATNGISQPTGTTVPGIGASLPANAWTRVVIAASDLYTTSATGFTGFYIQASY